MPVTLTSSVSNAAAIFDRHVSTIDVSASAGVDIHLAVTILAFCLATSLLLLTENERAKDDNMMAERRGWMVFIVPSLLSRSIGIGDDGPTNDYAGGIDGEKADR